MTRKIGVIGGTFDPIHLGHLAAATQVANRLGLDRVILAPAGEPWHKRESPGASPEDRFQMVELAAGEDQRFRVTRVDIDRPGPTFTSDTLRDLLEQHSASGESSDDTWFFIAGADALADFMQWREPMAILEQAHLVGVTRPGHTLAAPVLPTGSYTLVEIPDVDISSTDIRERVRTGQSITGLVPAAVESYIRERGLYLSPAGGRE
jgi:nicotinate-nucleotide adenylyltransferase